MLTTDTELEIPKVDFIKSVEEYIESKNKSFELIFVEFQRNIEKYKNMEARFCERKRELENNLAQLDLSLKSILHLKKNKDQEQQCEFELASGLFASASYKNVDVVYLWLGIGVMVEYPIDEAVEVLSKNKEMAASYILNIEKKIEVVKEQIVIIQVSMTRIHNWRVKNKPK